MPKRGKGQKGVGYENRLEAFRLYKMGWSYREIGAEIGVTFQRVGQYIKETLDELKEERLKLGKDIIERELENLAMMERQLLPLTKRRVWRRMEGGIEKVDVIPANMEAMQKVLNIQERRAKYLGLDAPKVLEHDVGDRLEDLIAGSRAPEEKK